MILNYKFKNFMSFKENVEFSMMAPKTKVKNRFPNNYVTSDTGIDVLKTAVVIGENAGGKSNFVRSLSYLQSFFVETETPKTYRNVINTNNNQDFCPKKNNTLQSFEIEVLIKENLLYLYHLEVDFMGIVKETFYVKNKVKNKYKKIFSMERSDYTIECNNENECTNSNKCLTKANTVYLLDVPGSENEIEKSLEKAANKEKLIGLTITKLAMLGNEHTITFTDWIKNYLCPETNIINYDIYKSMKNEDDDLRILHDSRYLDIFRMVDHSIISFKVDEEKPFSKTIIVRRKKDGSTFTRELVQDSSGVREYFAWAVQIFKVVYENKTVFADEMDRVLNPVLSDRVISFICGKNHSGQFVFTTHNVLHLDLKNYMKEQIYFITKDIETLESELYSLADFPEIRYETTKIYEFYMKGILGGTAIE
ncbi:AAA family ATPase [Faecalicatena orotica]|uniref:AAA family ATPase n=1 Tax=Faecalicatena orotica TaxID=1544 RepID=UPI003217DC88